MQEPVQDSGIIYLGFTVLSSKGVCILTCNACPAVYRFDGCFTIMCLTKLLMVKRYE